MILINEIEIREYSLSKILSDKLDAPRVDTIFNLEDIWIKLFKGERVTENYFLEQCTAVYLAQNTLNNKYSRQNTV